MQQEDYRKLYKSINKSWADSVSIYKNLVAENINKDTVVLEAGCGFSNLFKNEYQRAKKVIGVDVNKEFLELNPLLKEKIVANLESMPQVKDKSIDLIISSWVLEHLKNPKEIFKEFSRVLKEGGKVIFLTPNALNYVVILNRLIPASLRNLIAKRMNKDLVTDPMPAFYKANSWSRIKSLASDNGFQIEEFILNGDPTYIAISKLFFFFGVALEAILSLPFLKNFRVHIICVLKSV
ncbi:class I SAM-dependent methyltransferase [Candidatus Dojkabacteria bacterium]|nr:class I SAM-dependent methyltransferase [Candidatus Dojkabacteria bacterium]